MATVLKRLLVVAAVTPLLYLTSCTALSLHLSNAQAHLHAGDSVATVIARLGQADGVGSAMPGFPADSCAYPCARRLWYENRLSLGGEALSVDFDSSGRVVGQYHWVSP